MDSQVIEYTCEIVGDVAHQTCASVLMNERRAGFATIKDDQGLVRGCVIVVTEGNLAAAVLESLSGILGPYLHVDGEEH